MKKTILLLIFGLMLIPFSNAQAPDIDIGELHEITQKSEIVIATVNIDRISINEVVEDNISYSYQEDCINIVVVENENVTYRLTPYSYNYTNAYSLANTHTNNKIVAFENPVRKVANMYYYPDYY